MDTVTELSALTILPELATLVQARVASQCIKSGREVIGDQTQTLPPSGTAQLVAWSCPMHVDDAGLMFLGLLDRQRPCCVPQYSCFMC